jgi:hypothetical protein
MMMPAGILGPGGHFCYSGAEDMEGNFNFSFLQVSGRKHEYPIPGDHNKQGNRIVPMNFEFI